MAARNYSNIAVETTLSGSITNVQTTCTITADTGWPAVPFTMEIENEVVLVTGRTGTSISAMTRGYDGTANVSHDDAVLVRNVVVAADFDLIWDHSAAHSDGGDDEITVVDLGSAAQGADFVLETDGAGGLQWVDTPPDVLTTKGDLHGFSTVDARLPVGTNDHVLTADSAQTLGVKWAATSGSVPSPTANQYMLAANAGATAFVNMGLPEFNVLDPEFAADATGASDTSTAIQNAIDAAETAGGGIVRLPAYLGGVARYRIDTGLIVPENVVLLGPPGNRAGWGISGNGAHSPTLYTLAPVTLLTDQNIDMVTIAAGSGSSGDWRGGGVGYLHFGDYSTSTGTATSTDVGTTLTDTAASFQTDGIYAGMTVRNVTDGSNATVTSVTSETVLVHTSLANGSENDWDIGESYRVERFNEAKSAVKMTEGHGNFIDSCSASFMQNSSMTGVFTIAATVANGVQYAQIYSPKMYDVFKGIVVTSFPGEDHEVHNPMIIHRNSTSGPVSGSAGIDFGAADNCTVYGGRIQFFDTCIALAGDFNQVFETSIEFRSGATTDATAGLIFGAASRWSQCDNVSFANLASATDVISITTGAIHTTIGQWMTNSGSTPTPMTNPVTTDNGKFTKVTSMPFERGTTPDTLHGGHYSKSYSATSGGTVNLPDMAIAEGRVYLLNNRTGGTLILDPFGSQTIGNTGSGSYSTTYTMVDDETAWVVCDALRWNVISLSTDADAIHDNVSGEINAVTVKSAPTVSDLLLIEDAASSNAKKKITIGTIPRQQTLAFSHAGDLETGTGVFRLPMDYAGTIVSARAMVSTAPTGTSAIFDVNLNGTTIFSTQGNRPTIAISGTDSGSDTPNTTSFSAGDYFTIDIDQIGSTIAGANAVVVVVIEPS